MMNSSSETSQPLAGFSGLAPVFPLPNAVLFPHLALPLHIFEDRYRSMVADAIRGERLIALALLKPGCVTDDSGRPEICEMMCLGKITAEERLPSGRYNIILEGLQRAVLVEEPSSDRPYRTGKFELYRDLYSREPLIDRDLRSRELLHEFRGLVTADSVDGMLSQLLDANIPLGILCDLLANALQTSVEVKQEILEELDVDLRSDLLLMRIRETLRVAKAQRNTRTYPPPFSLN